jgi:hypothetical protein
MLASMQPEPDDLDLTTHTLRPGADFLQFAVAFAQMDLERLRQGDWLNLREEFEASLGRTSFIGASGNCILAYPTAPTMLWDTTRAEDFPLPQDYTAHDFQKLQTTLLPHLQNEAAETTPVGTMYTLAYQWVMHGLNRSTPGRRQRIAIGVTAECFLYMLEWLLDQEPPGRILTCPECGTLFYRFKHQAYCSRKCGNRLTVRNFRARQAAGLPCVCLSTGKQPR